MCSCVAAEVFSSRLPGTLLLVRPFPSVPTVGEAVKRISILWIAILRPPQYLNEEAAAMGHLGQAEAAKICIATA